MAKRSDKKILVVDDDQATRCTIRGILQSSEADAFEIIEAGSGTECLMAAEREGPVDLILLDIEMPDLDGFAICKAIRSVDPDVPIVFVTAHGEVQDRAAGRRAGCDSYLVKPVQPSRLLALVNLLISTRKHHTGHKKARQTAA